MAKVKAIRFSDPGGPDVLHLEQVDLPPPGRGEVTIRHTAIGLNFIDTYERTGLYPLQLPAVRQAIAKGRPLIANFGAQTVTEPVGGFGLAKAR